MTDVSKPKEYPKLKVKNYLPGYTTGDRLKSPIWDQLGVLGTNLYRGASIPEGERERIGTAFKTSDLVPLTEEVAGMLNAALERDGETRPKFIPDTDITIGIANDNTRRRITELGFAGDFAGFDLEPGAMYPPGTDRAKFLSQVVSVGLARVHGLRNGTGLRDSRKVRRNTGFYGAGSHNSIMAITDYVNNPVTWFTNYGTTDADVYTLVGRILQIYPQIATELGWTVVPLGTENNRSYGIFDAAGALVPLQEFTSTYDFSNLLATKYYIENPDKKSSGKAGAINAFNQMGDRVRYDGKRVVTDNDKDEANRAYLKKLATDGNLDGLTTHYGSWKNGGPNRATTIGKDGKFKYVDAKRQVGFNGQVPSSFFAKQSCGFGNEAPGSGGSITGAGKWGNRIKQDADGNVQHKCVSIQPKTVGLSKFQPGQSRNPSKLKPETMQDIAYLAVNQDGIPGTAYDQYGLYVAGAKDLNVIDPTTKLPIWVGKDSKQERINNARKKSIRVPAASATKA